MIEPWGTSHSHISGDGSEEPGGVLNEDSLLSLGEVVRDPV